MHQSGEEIGVGTPVSRFLRLIRFSHTVFALPFALWSLDQRNPRTASRHLLISKSGAIVLLAISSGGFLLTAAAINRLTLILAPVALALIFFYSLTKRFTSATHFFLGLALGIAPVGAWIAQTGRVDFAPIVLAAGVIGWVAGFDLIYATQ